MNQLARNAVDQALFDATEGMSPVKSPLETLETKNDYPGEVKNDFPDGLEDADSFSSSDYGLLGK